MKKNFKLVILISIVMMFLIKNYCFADVIIPRNRIETKNDINVIQNELQENESNSNSLIQNNYNQSNDLYIKIGIGILVVALIGTATVILIKS